MNQNHLCPKDEGIIFDIKSLVKIYLEVFSKYSRHYQTKKYCGIAFQGSHDLDHITGVNKGTLAENGFKVIDGEEYLTTISSELINDHIKNQVKTMSTPHKTLCVGEFKRILEYLQKKGYSPFRARVMELYPRPRSQWHIDGYDGSTRYHIPLITNDKCYLEWKDDNDQIFSFHLPADGSGYWINTDVFHRFINEGDTIRAHIVIDVLEKQIL
jgi:hypothetical protein